VFTQADRISVPEAQSKQGTGDEATKPKLDAVNQSDAGVESPASKKSVTRKIMDALEDYERRGGLALFHTPGKESFAQIRMGEHRETYPVRSKQFRHWLNMATWRIIGTPATRTVLDTVIEFLDSKACINGPKIPVYTRIAAVNGKIYIDLGTPEWNAVEVTSEGWEIVRTPPVQFRRHQNMAPLPIPKKGGDIAKLRPFINLSHDRDWYLLIAFIIAAFRGRGPFVILLLIGPQGAAKTTTARIIKKLIDPAVNADLRSLPKDEKDLGVYAKHSYALAFDNVSRITPWLSDALCRISTGAGQGGRQLYTDDEESILDAVRPICLNGIEEFAERADLLDRAITTELSRIDEKKRKDEETFWQEFEAVWPEVFGGLLGALAEGLKNYPTVKLDKLPRMADFVRWVVACEPRLGWKPGAFMKAYTRNNNEAVASALETDSVAQAVRDFIRVSQEWTGTATELLNLLKANAPDLELPEDAKGLSNRLRRCQPSLWRVGVQVKFKKSGDRRIFIKAKPGKQSETRRNGRCRR
jgi:hypothetical protein